MTITTMDELVNAMGNNSSRIIIDKTSLANSVAGQYFSLWRSLGYPGQGIIPTTTPLVLTNSTLGALGFTQQTSPATSYLASLEAITATSGMTLELHDRLMHMGTLLGNTTSTQTVNLDISANLATSNLDARKGDANYSDIQWWMEWYTDTGATASNATINVTFNDGTSSNLTAIAVGGTVRASRMIPLNSLIATGDAGKYIRDINSITLSGTGTGAAGNFGFTATRYRAGVFCPVANARFIAPWAEISLPEIFNSSCLFPIIIANTTSTGAVRGTGKIIHG
jgi:hypothetical protein